ncbi:MAG: hypothetical protein H0V93_05500, partial [Euzebyales bacterium]|nr:hypothetical protein [Euzebyales bacterium]
MRATIRSLLAQASMQDAGAGTQAGLWIARLGNYAALTATVGLLLAAVVLLGRGERLSPAATTAARRAAAAATVWVGSALALFTFGVSNASARPLPGALRPEIIAQFAGTRFGTAVLAQAAVAVTAAVIAARART